MTEQKAGGYCIFWWPINPDTWTGMWNPTESSIKDPNGKWLIADGINDCCDSGVITDGWTACDVETQSSYSLHTLIEHIN